MAIPHCSVADRLPRAQRQKQQAASDFGTAYGGVLQLDKARGGRVFPAQQVQGDLRVVEDEREFIIEIFTGSQSKAAQPIQLIVEHGTLDRCEASFFLHTGS